MTFPHPLVRTATTASDPWKPGISKRTHAGCYVPNLTGEVNDYSMHVTNWDDTRSATDKRLPQSCVCGSKPRGLFLNTYNLNQHYLVAHGKAT